MDTILRGSAETAAQKDYAELSRRVREAGLLKKNIPYEIVKILSTLSLLTVTLFAIASIQSTLARLLLAPVLAFVSVQLGFILHDAAHQQPFIKGKYNDALGLIFGNLLIGLSYQKWKDSHNEHHSNPNHLDMDPDIDIPFLAFHQSQLAEKKGMKKFIVKHQAFFFIPLTFFQAFSARVQNVRFSLAEVFPHNIRYPRTEFALMALHFVLYGWFVFSFMSPVVGIAFIIIHHAITGAYMASVFAPNHKGMPNIDDKTTLDFVRTQVLTARNVHSNSFLDYWYGGLNYQIEHHLFTTMPRCNLKRAKAIVQQFCKERDIPYYETSMFRSIYEIHQHLHAVSAPLRAQKTA